MAGPDLTFLDVAVPSQRARQVRFFQSGPETSNSSFGSGYDDVRWNWTGKSVHGHGCRAILALMGSSFARCKKAESIPVPSVQRLQPKKRIVAISPVRRQQPKRDIAPACVA